MALVKTNVPTLSSMVQDLLKNDFTNWTNNNFSNTNTTIPAVNIIESKDDYRVEMAAPGMKKSDFNIELKDNVLTISSDHRQGERNEDGHYLRREFSYQSFHRSFNLNSDVIDQSKIKATYQNGVLRLALPKREEAKPKPPRKIAVN